MPTRKINDAWPGAASGTHPPCHDREHRPPNMQVFEPGTYEHECPSCRQRTVFTVNGFTHGSVAERPKAPTSKVGWR